ncbi:MAG TPA: OmpA family protein [Polyangiaceae bacterium]
MRWMILHAAAIIVTTLTLDACVSRARYDQAVSDASEARAESKTALAEARRRTCPPLGAAEFQQQASELEVLRGELAQANEDLAMLRRAEQAARQRAELYKGVSRDLHTLVDAGELHIVVRDGRMILQLPDDVLFDPGSTVLRPAGREALRKIADVMLTIRERQYQIAGHTDDRPTQASRFLTNWELSTQRALAVLHFLVDQGVRHDSLSAAGFADVDPIGSNATPEGRAQNRRVEITVQPNTGEFVPIPDQ